MSGVVVACCSRAIASPAKSPARRPTDNTRVSIGPPLVAGKAQAVAGIVRGVVYDLRIGKACQEDQPESQKQGDARCSKRLAPLGRPDDVYSHTVHLEPPWLPL